MNLLDKGPALDTCRPGRWFILFFEQARGSWWSRRAPIGRFRHAAALGYVRELDCWVWYDVSLARTRIELFPEGPVATEVLGLLYEEATVVLSMPVYAMPPRFARIGFWCVPSILHLVGVSSCALRPDTLHRVLLEHGAAVIADRRAYDGSGDRYGADPAGQANLEEPEGSGEGRAGPADRGNAGRAWLRRRSFRSLFRHPRVS